MKNNVLYCICSVILLISCTDKEDQNTSHNTPVSGVDTVYVDESVFDYISAAKPLYDSAFHNSNIALISVSARRAMSLLFSDSSQSVIVARDYLFDEDSIVKSLDIKHSKISIAQDGLVLFVKKSFPLDTINYSQLQDIFSGKNNSSVKELLKNEYTIGCLSLQSSEYGNLIQYFSKDHKKLSIPLVHFYTRDSLTSYVLNNNAIGIGMMSYILKDSTLKALRIGFEDSTGKRIPPQIVHPGFIVQKKYPLIVPIFAYLRDEKRNLAWGFATYLEKDPSIQKVLLNQGIVPVFAKYNLIQED